ncbi:MAG: hydroxyisourate hydrolase [Rhodobacteraceae bacterium]|nr:MAG: hydroxyisourate hydrolase [Paracoccaceae bacterium]
MGRLTTHVLDTAAGRPAAGLGVALYRIGPDGAREPVAQAATNADGRLDAPLLAGPAFAPGVYELVFDAGAYLAAQGATLTDPPFLEQIPIRFGMAEDGHYHVPLLLSPYGYATYRGS